jgi:hypothetical protein
VIPRTKPNVRVTRRPLISNPVVTRPWSIDSSKTNPRRWRERCRLSSRPPRLVDCEAGNRGGQLRAQALRSTRARRTRDRESSRTSPRMQPLPSDPMGTRCRYHAEREALHAAQQTAADPRKSIPRGRPRGRPLQLLRAMGLICGVAGVAATQRLPPRCMHTDRIARQPTQRHRARRMTKGYEKIAQGPSVRLIAPIRRTCLSARARRQVEKVVDNGRKLAFGASQVAKRGGMSPHDRVLLRRTPDRQSNHITL